MQMLKVFGVLTNIVDSAACCVCLALYDYDGGVIS